MSTPITAAEIIDALRAVDITAEVGQSGGGCATIYVGPTVTDDNGDTIHACLIGPGSYHWTEPLASTFYSGDLYAGPDDAGDDQDAVKTCATVDEVVDAVRATLGATSGPLAVEVEREGLRAMLARLHGTPLAEIVRNVYPNAEPLWGHGLDSAMFPWADCTVIITAEIDDSRQTYMLGVYRVDEATGEQSDEPVYFVDLPRSPSAVLMYLHDVTELTPEGVDWAAWAAQWTIDAIDDGRLPGVTAQRLGEDLHDGKPVDEAPTGEQLAAELTDEVADRLTDAIDTMSEIIDACGAAGFTPTDDLDTLPSWVATWAAARHQGETIAVVDWTDEVITLEHRTSSTGIRLARATFTTDRIGLRLFANTACLWP